MSETTQSSKKVNPDVVYIYNNMHQVYGESLFFILQALTITAALNWHYVIEKLIEKYISKSNNVPVQVIVAIISTAISVILHIKYSKNSKKPMDIE